MSDPQQEVAITKEEEELVYQYFDREKFKNLNKNELRFLIDLSKMIQEGKQSDKQSDKQSEE